MGQHEGDGSVVGPVDDGVDAGAVARADGGDPAADRPGAHAATSGVAAAAPAGVPT